MTIKQNELVRQSYVQSRDSMMCGVFTYDLLRSHYVQWFMVFSEVWSTEISFPKTRILRFGRYNIVSFATEYKEIQKKTFLSRKMIIKTIPMRWNLSKETLKNTKPNWKLIASACGWTLANTLFRALYTEWALTFRSDFHSTDDKFFSRIPDYSAKNENLEKIRNFYFIKNLYREQSSNSDRFQWTTVYFHKYFGLTSDLVSQKTYWKYCHTLYIWFSFLLNVETKFQIKLKRSHSIKLRIFAF